MNQALPPLLLALILSLSLHGLLLGGLPEFQEKSPPPPPVLQATLKPLPAPPPPQPLPELEIEQPEPQPPRPKPPAKAPPRPVLNSSQGVAAGTLPASAAQEARKQLSRMASKEGFYPLEAIARGLQGEVLVQIFLNPEGHVIAARIDTSSGHDILDQAALRAARALRSLPSAGLEEAILPVRFRLE